MIHDVLQLARIESGGHQLNSEPVPLVPIVTECLDRHRARAASRGLTLVQEPTDLNPVIQGDDDALDHILDNLVDNAIKYTPKGGTITLRFDRENDDEIIEIRDTGDGINERDLPRIFERFYRVDKARSRNIPGTGLGLAIVKHLTSAMKGTIRVKSRVGHGTTFRIALPRSRDG
jgi:two-component system phosphate regulon sensor histidine kinase PhoR